MKRALTLLPLEPVAGCHGEDGCGTCSKCKENRRRALGKIAADRPYLGPIPFSVQFPAPGWMIRAHSTTTGSPKAVYNSLSHRFPPLAKR